VTAPRINWTDTFGNPVRGFTDCRGATDLSSATRHARGDRAGNQPGRSVILGEKEGDRLPVQAREVLKFDHVNSALPRLALRDE